MTKQTLLKLLWSQWVLRNSSPYTTDKADNRSLFGMLLAILPRDLGAHTRISYLFNLFINSCTIFSQQLVFLFSYLNLVSFVSCKLSTEEWLDTTPFTEKKKQKQHSEIMTTLFLFFFSKQNWEVLKCILQEARGWLDDKLHNSTSQMIQVHTQSI